MGRRKKSGLFETLVKSTFGVGTTVHYKSDWLGRKQKVVTHHDSGKKKTYTHGAGFFGGTTRTKTVKNGRTIEEGVVRKNLFFSGAKEVAFRKDGTKVHRSYEPGIFKDHIRTHENGVCFRCGGRGEIEFDCRSCDGTGTFKFPDTLCYACDGTSIFFGKPCHRCHGGIYEVGETVTCNKCDGDGHRDVTCNKCSGSGKYSKSSYK